MLFGNQKVIEDSVARLGISNDDVLTEVRLGNGQALLEIEKKKPSKIYAVKISEDFRKVLCCRFNRARITIIGNDTANLASIVPDKSIDKALLINVIFFGSVGYLSRGTEVDIKTFWDYYCRKVWIGSEF